MTKLLFFFSAFVFAWNIITPGIASAVDIPCKPSDPVKEPGQYQNDVFNCVNDLYTWGLVIATIAAVFMIILGGYMYIFSGGSESRVGTAKSFIQSSLLGLAVLVAGFLVLQQINPSILDVKNISPPQIGSEDYFDVPINGDLSGGRGGGPVIIGGGGSSPGTGNGQCTQVPSGPGSVANLSQTCFGSNAGKASIIANKESRGSASAPSGSDVCGDGNVASWGLFQINISANDLIDGKGNSINCPAAFNKMFTANHARLPREQRDCRVVNVELYKKCVAAATDLTWNIATACKISKNGSDWRQWGSYSSCRTQVNSSQ